MSYSRLQERVAELEGLLDNERLYTAEHRGYAQVIGEENKLLREQLDAARQVVQAFTAEAEDWNDGEFALWRKDDLVNALVRLRAALGDVAAAEQTTDLVSAPSKTEGRAGDKEAL